MTFTRAKVKTIRTEIDKALAAVAAKHGVEFSLGTIRFSDTDLRGTLKCVSADKDAGRKMFERDAFRVGVKKDAYGKTFTSNGKTFRITGINTRAKKYPICAETVNRGDKYKFPVRSLPSNLRS